jgi:asparagine synthase (glutamine-hydrolysing)
MCGILGIFNTRPLKIPYQKIAHALGLMQHRGPDTSLLTFFTDYGNITVARDSDLSYIPPAYGVLGHNRLAIIDRSARGNQPMPFGECWMAYNGEIYNYKNLRAILQEQGETFLSNSDTEVLLTQYQYDGPDMLHKLNGMFAFAIWDNAHKQVFLARDRYGIKPLYYTRLQDGAFALASEVKSLVALPGFDKTLDYTALSEHLSFQNTLGNKTLFRSVRILEPGHWARFDVENEALRIQKYWEPVFSPEPALDAHKAIEAFRHLMLEAVQGQLAGDAPIGSFLSGGLDTGVITTLAAQKLPHLDTYTAGFETTDVSAEEQLFDERETARRMAERLQTQHHEISIGPQMMPELLKQVVWHLDDFRAGISYQNYVISQIVQKDVTVVLSGVGGDELLAGYPWRYQPLLEIQPGDFPAHYYQVWQRLLTDQEKESLCSPCVQKELADFSTQERFQEVLADCKAETPLEKALCFDMKTFMHGLLIVEDRLSMAHSVESRVPFLDNRLVDFCLKLPSEFKLRASGLTEPVSKWLLREAFKGDLPDCVLTQQKQGFTPPDASWYRLHHRPFIESVLLSSTALERNLFEPGALKNILDTHWSGARNHRFLIWSLLCLEQWQRLFVDVSP